MSSVSPVLQRQPLSVCSGNIDRSPSEVAGSSKRARPSAQGPKDYDIAAQPSASASPSERFSLSKTISALGSNGLAAARAIASGISHSASGVNSQATLQTSSSGEMRASIEDESGGSNPAVFHTEQSGFSNSGSLTNRSSSHQRRPSTMLDTSGSFLGPSLSKRDGGSNAAASASISQLVKRHRQNPRDAHERLSALQERSRSLARVKDAARDKERVQQVAREGANAHAPAERELESIRAWQQSWKQLLSTSSFYFDSIDEPSKEKMPNKDKIKRQLINFGVSIETFFHGEVTHVISNRPLNGNYAPKDIISQAKQRSMKIWTYSKLERFMNNMTEHASGTTSNAPSNTSHAVSRGHIVASDTSNNLTRMLREEKLSASTDMVREDFQQFIGPYIFIRDAYGQYHPIMNREFKRVADPHKGDWPQLRITGSGKSPFIVEMSQKTADDARPARVADASTLKLKRPATITTLDGNVTSKGSSKARKVAVDLGRPERECDIVEDEEDDDEEADMEESMRRQTAAASFKKPPAPKRAALTPVRMTSVRANSNGKSIADAHSKKQLQATGRLYQERMSAILTHETVATGFNMSNVTSNIRSMTQSGGAANGLGAGVSHSQSKEVNNLKRKVFERKQKPMPVPQVALTKEAVAARDMKPGFCENCKDKFDDYEEHVQSRKHRKFAMHDENFGEIDSFMETVVRRPCRTGD